MLGRSVGLRSIRQSTVRCRMEGAGSLLRRWVYCNPGPHPDNRLSGHSVEAPAR